MSHTRESWPEALYIGYSLGTRKWQLIGTTLGGKVTSGPAVQHADIPLVQAATLHSLAHELILLIFHLLRIGGWVDLNTQEVGSLPKRLPMSTRSAMKFKPQLKSYDFDILSLETTCIMLLMIAGRKWELCSRGRWLTHRLSQLWLIAGQSKTWWTKPNVWADQWRTTCDVRRLFGCDVIILRHQTKV